MFKRFFDFVVHLKKQSILYPAVNSNNIHDVKEMVYLFKLDVTWYILLFKLWCFLQLNRTKEWNANIEKRFIAMKSEVRNNISLMKKQRENIKSINETYTDKEKVSLYFCRNQLSLRIKVNIRTEWKCILYNFFIQGWNLYIIYI